MSIETFNIATNITLDETGENIKEATLAEAEDSTNIPEDSMKNDPRVKLHNEAVEILKKLHELQSRHTILQLGLIGLAAQFNDTPSESLARTRASMTKEYQELAKTIGELRDEQRTNITEITAHNQTVTRPREDNNDPNNEANKAERRRIEQPYIIQIYNNGEDPTKTDGLPGHLVGANYRYLSNAPI